MVPTAGSLAGVDRPETPHHHLDGREFGICEVDGGPLYDPTDDGAVICGWSSACPHGFECGYGLRNGQLVLVSLWAYVSPSTELPRLGPGEPVHARSSERRWSGLVVPIPFCGALLVGYGQRHPMLRFAAARLFHEVWELEFNEGRLVRRTDVSALVERVAELRAAAHDGDADAEATLGTMADSQTWFRGHYSFDPRPRAPETRERHDLALARAKARSVVRREAVEQLLASGPKREGPALRRASRRLRFWLAMADWLEGSALRRASRWLLPMLVWNFGLDISSCPRCRWPTELRYRRELGLVLCDDCNLEMTR